MHVERRHDVSRASHLVLKEYGVKIPLEYYELSIRTYGLIWIQPELKEHTYVPQHSANGAPTEIRPLLGTRKDARRKTHQFQFRASATASASRCCLFSRLTCSNVAVLVCFFCSWSCFAKGPDPPALFARAYGWASISHIAQVSTLSCRLVKRQERRGFEK